MTMIRSYPCLQLVLLLAVLFNVEGKFDLDKVGVPLTAEELRHGEAGYGCLKELLGEQGEHVLTQHPTKGIGFHKDTEDINMTDQDRYEAIFLAFGKEGLETVCDITSKLRLHRLLKPMDAKPLQPKHPERRAQSCVEAKPMYPSENDVGNTYNDWMAEHVDQFLPEGADRTSRTDPNILITDIQDAIDVVMEAEYASMACRPIFDGIQAIVTIPDAVVIQQGSIVGGIKSFVCGFGSQVASAATGELYKQLGRARYHDYYIDGAESSASYKNMKSMVNQVCTSNGRLKAAVGELDAIKRKLETR